MSFDDVFNGLSSQASIINNNNTRIVRQQNQLQCQFRCASGAERCLHQKDLDLCLKIQIRDLKKCADDIQKFELTLAAIKGNCECDGLQHSLVEISQGLYGCPNAAADGNQQQNHSLWISRYALKALVDSAFSEGTLINAQTTLEAVKTFKKAYSEGFVVGCRAGSPEGHSTSLSAFMIRKDANRFGVFVCYCNRHNTNGKCTAFLSDHGPQGCLNAGTLLFLIDTIKKMGTMSTARALQRQQTLISQLQLQDSLMVSLKFYSLIVKPVECCFFLILEMASIRL
jgi:hypothetical protein